MNDPKEKLTLNTQSVDLPSVQGSPVNIEDYSSGFKLDVISENDKFKIAKQILTAIGLFFLLFCVAFTIYPDNKALVQIYEFIKIALYPLCMLIVGYYFQKS